MKILNIKHFDGQHCETTATGTLLNQLGITLSEPMLFGLGEGLGFIFWNMKTMDYSFIGGRIKPDAITQNLANNLGLRLVIKETSSKDKAWKEVKQILDNGHTVGLKLDCYHLEYFSRPFHFAAHYAAIYGYDDELAYLVDTRQQGGLVKTSLNSLALARAEKGPMSSKNLYYTLKKSETKINLKDAIVTAIKNNANNYLTPPIANIGYKGILKTGSEIIKWFKRSENVTDEFRITSMLMEKAGTGGALFRNLYRDFLKESYELVQYDPLKKGYGAFSEIASLWNTVSKLLDDAGIKKDITFINQASDILKNISYREKEAMELLIAI